jgi:hypothetical protein
VSVYCTCVYLHRTFRTVFYSTRFALYFYASPAQILLEKFRNLPFFARETQSVAFKLEMVGNGDAFGNAE